MQYIKTRVLGLSRKSKVVTQYFSYTHVNNMLWFKFIFGLKFDFCLFVSDYDNGYETMKNKYRTGLKNFKPKINLNHGRV